MTSTNPAPCGDPLTGGGTLGGYLMDACGRYAGRVAFSHEGGDTTYAELASRVSQAVRAFGELGLKEGSTVALLAGNSVEAYALMLATYVSGMRSVALHAMGSLADHAFVLDDSTADLVVADADFAVRALELRQRCAGVRHWFVQGHVPSFPDFRVLAGALPGTPVEPKGQWDSQMRLGYSGGTTGRPKAVIGLNRMWVTHLMTILAGTHFPECPKYLCALPITHGAGTLIAPVLVRGGRVVLQRRFSAEKFLDAMRTERCNMSWLVPTAIYALLDHPLARQVDWSCMETLVYSGAPMNPARIAQALQVFGPALVQMYGQAEAPGVVLILNQHDHATATPERLASAGRPAPGVRVSLQDDEGRPVPAGGIGEICVRGPLVMPGYWNQEALSAATLAGGWLHTGDLGRQDDAGYFYVVDRKKDMIISGGYNVYSAEVEAVLSRHPAVANAAVIGEPDPKWGEAVAAYVQLKPGCAVSAQALCDMVRQEKGAVHTPKAVHFVESLPVTAVGKVDKKQLRAAVPALAS